MPLNSAKAEGILSQQSVRRPTAKRARRTAISPGADLDAGVLCIPLFIAAMQNCSFYEDAKGGGSRLACGKFREAERLRSEAEADRPQSPSSRPQARNPLGPRDGGCLRHVQDMKQVNTADRRS